MENSNKWVGLFLLLILPSIIYLYVSKADNNFIHLEIIGTEGHRISEFSFINQDADTITNKDMEGNIYIADFFFTSCPKICPVMTNNMRYVQKKLSIYPNVRFLSHTVNPKTDTPERLKEYAIKMRADLSNWDFVTGKKEDLYSIAADYFVNADKDSLAAGGFLHSEYFVIVDKEGRVRSGTDKQGNVVGVYDGTKDHQLKELIKDVKVLLAEYHKPKKDKKDEK